FPNREGSKPGGGQIASVALMDARSVAATALNGGWLRSAETVDFEETSAAYRYDDGPYRVRVYRGAGRPDRNAALVYGPNITGWPEMESLGEDLLLKVVSFITDPVTTTDELIPSGETSSFRSNPLGLAEYTLSRKDPAYVGRAKAVRQGNEALREGRCPADGSGPLPELAGILAALRGIEGGTKPETGAGTEIKPETGGPAGFPQLGSAIFARRPGDGSAREQAASCQRVLGGAANFAGEYATKRYRSNLINWGILPFIVGEEPPFTNGDYLFIPGIRRAVETGAAGLTAWIISGGGTPRPFTLGMPDLNAGERAVLLAGSLINYNRDAQREKNRSL
ncbi:MAG: hydratase, partial [Treponema sp.]|nr:hydratase [Treponema sp.]